MKLREMIEILTTIERAHGDLEILVRGADDVRIQVEALTGRPVDAQNAAAYVNISHPRYGADTRLAIRSASETGDEPVEARASARPQRAAEGGSREELEQQ